MNTALLPITIPFQLASIFVPLLVCALVVLLSSLAIFAAHLRHKKSAQGNFAVVGSTGIVEEELTPTGAVVVRGEVWRAHSIANACIARGRRVRVLGACEHLLIVEAVSDD